MFVTLRKTNPAASGSLSSRFRQPRFIVFSCWLALAIFQFMVCFAPINLSAQDGGADFGQSYNTSVSANPYCKDYDGSSYPPGNYALTSSLSIQDQYGNWSPPPSLTLNIDGTCALNGPVSLNAASGSEQFDEYLNLTFSSNGNSIQFPLEVYGSINQGTATVAPKYVVLSILYDPPGNASTNGFQNSESNGSTNSTQKNFQNSNSVQVSFASGAVGPSGSVQFGVTNSSTDTSAFTTTYTATSSSQLQSLSNDIDHTQDQVFLWVDPTFNFTQNGPSSTYYSTGQLDSNGNFTNDNIDVINVSISEMQNPSTMNLQKLLPQRISPGVTLPGLASICANPLPASQCTQQNACGCVASDFANIVAQDELAGGTVQSKPLDQIDSSRYVYLTDVALEGPNSPGSTLSNSYSLSDASQSCRTTGNSTAYTVGVTFGWKFDFGFSFGVQDTDSFTVGQQQTFGTCNGKSHVGEMSAGSNVAGCYTYVDVYEDTVYHTFAFALPTVPQAPYPNYCGFTHQ